MRIGVDLTTFKNYQGTEVFAVGLLQTLANDFPQHEFVLFVNGLMLNDIQHAISGKNIRIVSCRLNSDAKNVLYQQLYLPWKILWMRIEVLYCPALFFSWCAPARKIITIHDASYAQFKEYRNMLSKAYILLNIWLAKVIGLDIITVSEFSKKELIECYKFKAGKISIIPEGVPQLSPARENLKDWFKSLSISPNKFFLYIGIGHLRKNVMRIIEATALLVKRLPEYKLVLAGSVGLQPAILKEINDLKMNSTIICLGRVDQASKAALLQHAAALIYPSLYEGFGLPILEAQSLATPVITSSLGVMPETAGKGAYFVNPYKSKEIEAGMREVVTNVLLRNELIQLGHKNIKRFSWNQTAKLLEKVLVGHKK